MFTSKRGLFSSEHGATTSWLAGITSAALLVAQHRAASDGDRSGS